METHPNRASLEALTIARTITNSCIPKPQEEEYREIHVYPSYRTTIGKKNARGGGRGTIMAVLVGAVVDASLLDVDHSPLWLREMKLLRYGSLEDLQLKFPSGHPLAAKVRLIREKLGDLSIEESEFPGAMWQALQGCFEFEKGLKTKRGDKAEFAFPQSYTTPIKHAINCLRDALDERRNHGCFEFYPKQGIGNSRELNHFRNYGTVRAIPLSENESNDRLVAARSYDFDL